MMEMSKIQELTDVIECMGLVVKLLEIKFDCTDNEEEKAMLKKRIMLQKQLVLQMALANETIKQINNCTGKD